MLNFYFSASVLDENKEAADILAKIVHSEVSVCDTCSTQNLDQNLIVENLGVWIDPIGELVLMSVCYYIL